MPMDDLIIYFAVFTTAIFLIVLFLAKPKEFILFFIIFSPIINIFWFYKIYDFSLVEIFSVIFPVFFIFIFLQRITQDRWVWGKYNRYFILVLISFVIPLLKQIGQGNDFRNAFELFIKVFCGYASYLLFINIFRIDEQKKVIRSVLYAVMITTIMVIIQLITGIGTGVSKDYYIKGFYHDPGQYTRMALVGIIILLPLFKLIKNKIDYIYKFLLLAFCIITLAVSISRNVVMSTASVVIVYGLLWRKYVFSLVIICVGVTIYFSSPVVKETYEARFQKEIQYLKGYDIPIEVLGSGRIGIWQRTINKFKESSLFEKLFGTNGDIGPHGQFFGLLKSVGIIGIFTTILFYLKLLVDTFMMVIKDKNNVTALYGFLMVFVVFIMSIASSPITNSYFQIILFAFIALSEKSEKVKQNEKNVKVNNDNNHA